MGFYVGFARISAVLRKLTADLREFTADLREFTADLRKFTANLRKFTADLRELTADLPGFTADLPEFTADLLEFTAGLCWFWPYLFAFGIKTQTKTDKKKVASKSGRSCLPPPAAARCVLVSSPQETCHSQVVLHFPDVTPCDSLLSCT